MVSEYHSHWILNLKKRLEEQFKHDRVAYTMGKADFIQEVINKASNDDELIRFLQERGSL